MSPDNEKTLRFDKYKYRSALECPTRLYYKRNSSYREQFRDKAVFKNISLNKMQMTALVKTILPNRGKNIDTARPREKSKKTVDYLKEEKKVTLYRAAFSKDILFAEIPICVKEDNTLHLYHIKTKAVKNGQKTLKSGRGKLSGKWYSYIQELAFSTYVVTKALPDYQVKTWLVLPDKSKKTEIQGLLQRFQIDETRGVVMESDRNESNLDESNIIRFFRIDSFIEKEWNGEYSDDGMHAHWQPCDFEERVEKMVTYFKEGIKIPPAIGRHCGRCEFRTVNGTLPANRQSGFEECWKEFLGENYEPHKQPILDLKGHGTEDNLSKSVYYVKDVSLSPEVDSVEKIVNKQEPLTIRDRQALQVLKERGHDVPREIIRPQLFDELMEWEYPLHFLDFEAANFLLPLRKGGRPYEPVVFQFSCHTLKETGELQHRDWIEQETGRFPNFDLVRNLRKISGIAEGTIFQYSPFEKEMLKKIRRQIKHTDREFRDKEKLHGWLNRMINSSGKGTGNRFVDMNRLVRKFYYNPDMEASLSLKDVISSIFNVSPVLKKRYSEPYTSANFDTIHWWQNHPEPGISRNPYDIINDEDESIREGGEAMMTYARLQQTAVPESKRKILIKALLKYCELDTLSMVMIYEHWHDLHQK